MIHVKTEEIYGKNEIMNSNDLRKHIVNIDSRFRKSYLEPPSDYIYEFAHPYKNVIKAKISSVEIPIGFYTFSNAKKNVMFRIDATDYVGGKHYLTVSIEEGDYTGSELVNVIQGKFNGIKDLYGLFFRIVLNANTNKVTIYHDGSGPPPSPQGPSHCAVPYEIMFGMVGIENRQYDFGLGYNLGFRQKMYEVKSPYSITSESLINTKGDNYFLLGMEDFNTVEHKTNDSYIKCFAKILIKRDVGSNSIIFDDGYTVLSNEIVFPRPIDLKQVRIRLMDMYGVLIDLHDVNYSISMEIVEVMNVQIYDTFRNYLWSKEEPRPVTHTSGSSAVMSVKQYN